MTARYAIYFSPERHSPWWQFGAHWLGRDECNGAPLAPPELSQFSTIDLQAVTAEPRRYGFHATLKAPFHLRGGRNVADLLAQMQTLAASLKPLPLGLMQVARLGNFVALMPVAAPEELTALAAQCVSTLDAWRAPLSAAELARRLSLNISRK